MDATEPDQLVFVDIPEALGARPVPASGKKDELTFPETARRLADACSELRNAFSGLMNDVRLALREHVGPSCDPLHDGLASRARELEGKIIDPQLERLSTALKAQIPDEQAWLAYVAMNTTGVPPEGWTDDDRRRFFVSITELGASFRRIYALNAHIEASGEGFDAYRHVITRSDGRELVELLAIDDSTRSVGLPLLTSAIDTVCEELGLGAGEAVKALLAMLGELEFGRQHSAVSGTARSHDGDDQVRSIETGA